MSIEFLTDAWFDASQETIDAIDGFEVAEPIKKIVVNLKITQKGSDDFIACYNQGVLEKGHKEGAESTVTIPKEMALAAFIQRDMMKAAKAMMMGKIRVAGNKAALMAAQTVRPSATQAEYEKKMQAITVL